MISTEKPGTPAELVHFGVKGMKWGVRNQKTQVGKHIQSAVEKNKAFWTPERKSAAKKVAIGVGILTAVAGAAFVTYKLNQSGKIPISALKKAPPKPSAVTAVKKILEEPTDIIHATRGKDKGFSFLKQGGIPNHLEVYERAFGADSGKTGVFEKLSDGSIASSFLDPDGKRDFAGRHIPHQVLIPKTMSEGINSQDDVMKKIWPKLKPAFDSNYSDPGYDLNK